MNRNRHITDLDPRDLEAFFNAAKQNDVGDCELFQERALQATLLLSDKSEHTLYESFQNTSLTLKKGSRTEKVQLQTLDLAPFITYLKTGELGDAANLDNTPHAKQEFNVALSELVTQTRENLLHRTLYKSHWEFLVGPIQAEIKLSQHFYEGHTPVQKFSSEETHAEILLKWQVEKDGKLTPHTLKESRHSLREIVHILRSGELKEEILRTLESPSLWPVPQGNHNVLWSEFSFADLMLPFVRGFESDSFLESPNYLSSDAPLPSTLKIEEIPENAEVDFEGTPKKAYSLLTSGKVKGLACTKVTAEQMQVNSTGHSRKNFFSEQKVPGFWKLKISGTESTAEILADLESGIRIEKIQWVQFNPQTYSGEIDVLRSVLVHQGKLGESLTPFRLVISLPEVLTQTSRYTGHLKKKGFTITKDEQTFTTEVLCPQAISAGIKLPGNVPAETYW